MKLTRATCRPDSFSWMTECATSAASLESMHMAGDTRHACAVHVVPAFGACMRGACGACLWCREVMHARCMWCLPLVHACAVHVVPAFGAGSSPSRPTCMVGTYSLAAGVALQRVRPFNERMQDTRTSCQETRVGSPQSVCNHRPQACQPTIMGYQQVWFAWQQSGRGSS